MAGFDDLIRGALEKQGEPDAERRAVIYNSSRQALERMLSQNTSLDAAAAAVQRDRLETSIATIENDYRAKDAAKAPPPSPPVPPVVKPAEPTPAAAVQPPIPPKPAPARPTTPPPAPSVVPTSQAAPPKPRMAADEVSPPVAPAPQAKYRATPTRVEPSLDPVVQSRDDPSSNLDREPATVRDFTGEEAPKERKPYAKLLLWTIILVGLGVAVWWAITFGPELLKQQFDGRVPNNSQPIQSGTFVPGEEDGWRKVFVPAENAENIDAAGRGTADIFVEGESSFVRMASAAGSARNTMRIKLPRGILFAIRGKAATFELIMKGKSDEQQQFGVFCEFGVMGECGRKRFKITDKAEAFIFDVLVNDVVLSAGNDAYLAINTDLSSSGKSIDLYSIRVRPSE